MLHSIKNYLSKLGSHNSSKFKAAEMLREDIGTARPEKKIDKTVVALVSLAWTLFQLALPRFVIIDSVTVRAIHLAFAVMLVFLCIPAIKSKEKEIPFINSIQHIPLLDYFLAIAGSLVILYMVFDWQGITARAGRPITRDIIMGICIIIVLFEASRRIIGIPMAIISIVFTVYAFAGPYMPMFLAFRGVSLNKYMSQIALSTEGIYGIPLDVSANTVFLFVFFGALLDKLGAGHFFNDLSLSLFGRFKGGPAKASVVSSGMTGLVSGSSIANVVTTGTFTIPLMKRVGYPGKIAAATEVAASTNGQLMPPIMGAAAFIIAEYLGVSYFEVIRAAFLPAFVSYIALFYITHLEASKLGMKGLAKSDVPQFLKVLKDGYYHLIPLFMLIYELAVLRHSPNLSVFNAIVVLTAILFIKELLHAIREKRSPVKAVTHAAKIWLEGALSGTRNMLSVALATAVAGIIVGIVNMGIGSMIVQIVELLSAGNVFLLLFITGFVSLVIGMGLPTTATYIVMATITVPVITTLGADMNLLIPAIAAHLFCFYFGILADDTPPVGLAAYAAAAIAESDPIPTGIKGFIYDLRTAIIPFMFVFNAELLLIGVSSPLHILLIFASAILGVLAFTNAVQGWFVVQNKIWEIPLLLLASFILLLPGRFARVIGLSDELRYLTLVGGLALYIGVYMLQKMRAGKQLRS